LPALFLPYEFTAVVLTGTAYDTDPFGIDPEQTTWISIVDTDPFGIDPEQTTLITTGLDSGP
jgi:hypothetical protein